MSEKPDIPPEHDVQTLAGEYVLGTLTAEQRADVQQRLAHDRALRNAVDGWEARFLTLTQLVEPQKPSIRLWSRIERSLDEVNTVHTSTLGSRTKPSTRLWSSVRLWRGLTAAGLAASLVLATLLATQVTTNPAPAYLVVLVAPQDKAPGWVVQASQSDEIQLIPLSETNVPEDKALQFWTKADDWKGPVSLGLVKPGQVLKVSLDKLPALQPNQLFELTLEKSTGSSIGKPTGPIQFIGRAVKVI